MRNLFRKFVILSLGFSVRVLLARKKPEVIAITGSAGKTSTKEFIKTILSFDYEVLAPKEGYNTEIGSALGLFSEQTPDHLNSPIAWFGILFRVFLKALFMRDLASKVIVEMGADKPGDIKYLTRIFKPKIGIILTVLPVHLEEFKSLHAVAAEKAELARSIPKNGKLFLNWDDSEVRKMSTLSKSEVIFFGKGAEQGIKIKKIKSGLKGMEGSLDIQGKELDFVTNLYGSHLVYPLVASIGVAIYEGIPQERIKKAIKTIKPFKGRMNLLEGIKGSVIIDDSYNANPESMIRALEFLGSQEGRRIAILGTMNELGDFEKEGHEKVGNIAAKTVDLLYTVGEIANTFITTAAKTAGMNKTSIKTFSNSLKAGQSLKKEIKQGDIILVKGSQNKVRTEIAIEQIMAHPEMKRELLVRQSDFWNGRA